MGTSFNLYTQIIDIIPGTIIFGIGIGLLLSQLTNLTMSAVRTDQETDAAGYFNAFKNLGYSIGTALIGVLLLLGIFGGITTSIENSSLSGNMTKEQIDSSVIFYVEKMQTGTLNVPPNTIPQVNQILDSTISSAMKQTFNILAIILLLGLVTTIFLPSRIKNS